MLALVPASCAEPPPCIRVPSTPSRVLFREAPRGHRNFVNVYLHSGGQAVLQEFDNSIGNTGMQVAIHWGAWSIDGGCVRLQFAKRQLVEGPAQSQVVRPSEDLPHKQQVAMALILVGDTWMIRSLDLERLDSRAMRPGPWEPVSERAFATRLKPLPAGPFEEPAEDDE